MRPGTALLTLVVVLLSAAGAISSRGDGGSPTTGRMPGTVVFFARDAAGWGSYHEIHPGSGTVKAITDPTVNMPHGALGARGRSAVVACMPDSLETSEDRGANHGICRIDLETGTRHLVVDAGTPVRHPTPSPDGKTIVFASGAAGDHGLKVTSVEGGEVSSLCSGFCPLFRFFDIAWSPDATRVAFVATTPGSAGHFPQIYVVTVGASDYTQLTASAGSELDPGWSPDGTRLAFTSSRTGDTEIWVMNADGSGQTRLTHRRGVDAEPAWSPDGTRIVYSRRIGDSWDLAVVPADGGEPQSLTSSPGTEYGPLWIAEPAF